MPPANSFLALTVLPQCARFMKALRAFGDGDFYRRQRPTPLPSHTAKSHHQSQLGVDGLDVAHARSVRDAPYVATHRRGRQRLSGAIVSLTSSVTLGRSVKLVLHTRRG
jgi:hypothetical protein